jgi:release factor glutamine methyltransferase
VPRPETELLVDAVGPALRRGPRPLAVDLGSGSGALALAIADEVPTADVVAVERPGPALAWLRRNTAGSRVAVVVADLVDPADPVDPWPLAALAGTVDVVVSNPPYVPETTAVEPEVRADPPGAVFAGVDGLGLLPAVIARAAELLAPGGVAAIEHDDSHEEAVVALLAADGRWREVVDHRDLTGRPRYVTATRTE